MSRFRPIDRDTDFLLPPSVQEWLPEAHLARYVAAVVENLDLSEIERAYAGRGSEAYHPATLLSLLIYGYATGTFSSRKIERATYDSLAFRYLACNRHPDHDTLATFRRRFGKQFESAFVQVLQVALLGAGAARQAGYFLCADKESTQRKLPCRAGPSGCLRVDDQIGRCPTRGLRLSIR